MLDDPKYPLSSVAEAIGYPVNTLRSHLQRGHWRLDQTRGDAAAAAQGKAHLVTLRRALHIGAAVELIRNDVDPARAYQAARGYSDIIDPTFEAPGHERNSSTLLFDPPAYTLLVAYPHQPWGVIMRVANDPKKPDLTPLQDLFFHPLAHGRQGSGVFVWLNQVDRQVLGGLAGKEQT